MSTFNKFAEMQTIKAGKNTSFGHLPDKSETNLWLTDAMIVSRMKATISNFSFNVNLGMDSDIEQFFYAMFELWDFLRTMNKRKASDRVELMDRYFDNMEQKLLIFRRNRESQKKLPFEMIVSLRRLKRDLFQVCQDWGFGTVMKEHIDDKKVLENAILG